jgi:hypothetical protein
MVLVSIVVGLRITHILFAVGAAIHRARLRATHLARQ